MWVTHWLSRSTMPSGPLVASFQGNYIQQLCMLIPLVWFAGQDSGAGTAVAAWERRTRGGAVQAKHSLAMVSGWHSAAHRCHRTWAMKGTCCKCLKCFRADCITFFVSQREIGRPDRFIHLLPRYVCMNVCLHSHPSGSVKDCYQYPLQRAKPTEVMSHIHSIVLTCNLCTSSYI